MAEKEKQVNNEEMLNKKGERKKPLYRSVLFRSWISFIVLALAIILFIWVGEVVVFSGYYSQMRTEKVINSNRDLIRKLENNDFSTEAGSFRDALNTTVSSMSMTVIIYEFEENGDMLNVYDIKERCNANPTSVLNPETKPPQAYKVITQEFLTRMSELKDTEKNFSYVEAGKGGKDTFSVVFGERIKTREGKYLYYYSASLILENDATVSVLLSQLQFVTSLCILIAVLISFLIAWQFSKPVRAFTATARKIGDGDRDIKYVGNGYNEFDELADALNYANSEIIKTEKLRRDFLANVSHDLRTPLTLVKAYAEMIRDISGGNKEKREANTQTIINEVDRLTMLVDDILFLSKLESGVSESEIIKESVDLSELTKSTLMQFRVMHETYGIDFEWDIDDNAIVSADYKRMSQVIYNLIGNAINYVGEDKKVIVNVKILQNDDKKIVRMEVTDNGKGIPSEEIDKVWDRYYRSNQNKRNTVGSGIGLSIVKNILISSGAKYGILSEQGKGTTFYFEMPYMGNESK